MFTFISVIIIIISILLVLIVLVQNSKGGGLAAGFSSSNQIMGVRRTTDFLEKATWTLAAGLMALSVLASVFVSRGERITESRVRQQVENTDDARAIPQYPMSLPQE